MSSTHVSSLKVKVTQSCPTLCNDMDYRVCRILQARILEWVAIPFSRGSSQPRNQTQVSCITDGFFTSWAIREDGCVLAAACNLLREALLVCQEVGEYFGGLDHAEGLPELLFSPCGGYCEQTWEFSSVTQPCLTLGDPGLQHARLPCPSPTPGVNSCPLTWE